MKRQNITDLVLLAFFVAVIIVLQLLNIAYIPLPLINITIMHIPVILGALFLGPKKGAFLGFLFGFTSFLNSTFRSVTPTTFIFSPIVAYSQFGFGGVVKSVSICFLPRILVGIVPYYIFLLTNNFLKKERKSRKTIASILFGLILGFSTYQYAIKLLGNFNIASAIQIILSIIISLVTGALSTYILYRFTINKKHSTISCIYAGLSGSLVNTFLVMGGILLLYKNAYAETLNVSIAKINSIILGIIAFNGALEAIIAAILVSIATLALSHILPTYNIRKNLTINK